MFTEILPLVLYIFYLASTGDAFHRAVINTHLSLLGSTSATFAVATFLGE